MIGLKASTRLSPVGAPHGGVDRHEMTEHGGAGPGFAQGLADGRAPGVIVDIATRPRPRSRRMPPQPLAAALLGDQWTAVGISPTRASISTATPMRRANGSAVSRHRRSGEDTTADRPHVGGKRHQRVAPPLALGRAPVSSRPGSRSTSCAQVAEGLPWRIMKRRVMRSVRNKKLRPMLLPRGRDSEDRPAAILNGRGPRPPALRQANGPRRLGHATSLAERAQPF